jgi:Kef-type K+ transport system membrane component KefB
MMEIETKNLRSNFREAHTEFARMGLLALMGIVAGIAAILFLSFQWAAAGIGILFVSAYSLYHTADRYHASKNLLARAGRAINA